MVPSWRHRKRGDYGMYRDAAGVFSRENARIDFFPVVSSRGGWGEWPGGHGKGKSALSVHSHPFDHSSSISGLDVECNSSRKARGTRQMAEGGSEGGEDKVSGIEAGEARKEG